MAGFGGIGSDIIAYLGVNDTQFSQKLNQANLKAERTAQTINKSLNMALMAGAAAFGAAVLAASKFEAEMANVNTLLDTSDEQFQQMNDDVLALAQTVPTAMTSLTKGLYDLVSAGAPAESAVSSLELAAKAAAAGLTGVDVAVRAGMATLNAYGLEISELNTVYDLQFSTVKKGVITYEQLANSIGTVLPAAKTLNVSMEDMYASIAFLTKAGQSAEMSTTNLSRAFQQFVQQKDKLAALGIQVFDTTGKFRGMENIVGELAEVTHGMSDEMKLATLKTLDFDIRAGRALTSMINNYDMYRDTLHAVADSSGAMGEAFQKQMDTFSAQSKVFKNIVQTSFIDLGRNDLLPVLKDILTFFNRYPATMSTLIQNVSKLAITVGVAVAAFKALSKAFMLIKGHPVMAAIVGLTALYIGLKTAIDAAHQAELNQIDSMSDEVDNAMKLSSEFERLKNKKDLTERQTKRLNDITKILTETYKKAGIEVDKLEGNTSELYEQYRQVRLDELTQQHEELTEKLTSVATGQGLFNKALLLAATVTGNHTGALGLYKKRVGETTEKLAANKKEQEELNSTTRILNQLGIQTNEQIEKQIAYYENLLKTVEPNTVQYKALSGVVENLKNKLNEANDSTKHVIDTEKLLTDAGIKTTQALKDKITELEKLLPIAKDDALATKQLKDKIAELNQELFENQSIKDFIEHLKNSKQPAGDLTQVVGDIRTNFDDLNPSLVEASTNTINLTDAIKDSDETAKKFKESLAPYGSLLREITQGMEGLSPAQQAFAETLVTMVGTMDPLSIGLSMVSMAMQGFNDVEQVTAWTTEEVIESLGALGDQIVALEGVVNNLTVTFDSNLISSYQAQIDKLVEWLTQAEALREAMGDFVPQEFLDQITAAKQALAETTAELDRLLATFAFELDFEKVLGGLTDLTGWTLEMMAYFGDAFNMSGVLELLSEQVLEAIGIFGGLDPDSQAWQDMGQQIWDTITLIKESGGDLGVIIAVLAQMGVSWADMVQWFGEGSIELQNFNQTVADTPPLVIEVANDLKKLTDEIKNTNDQVREVNPPLKEFDETILKMPANIRDAKDSLDEWGNGLKELDEDLQQVNPPLNEFDDTILKMPANIRDAKNSLGDFDDGLQQVTPEIKAFAEDTQDAADAIDDLNQEIEGIIYNWERMYDVMFANYDWFESTVSNTAEQIQQLLYFNIDLDTTQMDEQIAQAIYQMMEYLGTLDPDSQAYADARAALDDLIDQFRLLGGNTAGVIDFINLLINRMNDIPSDINTDVNVRYINSRTGDQTRLHGGGFVGLERAHGGKLFSDEQMAILKKGEYVLKASTVKKHSPVKMEAFNVTGNPEVFGKSSRHKHEDDLLEEKVPIQVVIHEASPSTWVEIVDENIDPRLKINDKYTTTISSFR